MDGETKGKAAQDYEGGALAEVQRSPRGYLFLMSHSVR